MSQVVALNSNGVPGGPLGLGLGLGLVGVPGSGGP